MNENKGSHHSPGGQGSHSSDQETHHPYWKRAHQDWRVWVAVFLMLAAMLVYVFSEGLLLRPSGLPPRSDAVGI